MLRIQKNRDIMAHDIEDLMSDCDLYVWEKVRAFHGVLLNQMEQCMPILGRL